MNKCVGKGILTITLASAGPGGGVNKCGCKAIHNVCGSSSDLSPLPAELHPVLEQHLPLPSLHGALLDADQG